MRLLAYAKLLNNKINALNRQTQNPYINWNNPVNPFRQKDYHTMIWIEPEDKNYSEHDDY